MNVLMLYPKFPDETFWNQRRSERTFLHCRATTPPLGLLTIASYLPDDFKIRLIDRNVREESDADWRWADVVFVSLMLIQYKDYQLCIRNAKRYGKPVAIGGPFTHAWPDIAQTDGDWMCMGEAEDIMEQLIDDIRADRRGRQYHGGSSTNVEHVRIPRFDLLRLNDYATITIQFSRGCPFRCEFCDIIEIYGRIPRTKTPAQVLAELTALRRLGYTGQIFLVDDNFIGNKKKVKVMLRELVRWNHANRYPYAFTTQASLNLGDDEELLEAMAEANFRDVFIGIETTDPDLLKTTLKTQNMHADPLARLSRIREHGIHITAGFIVGFDGERSDVFEAQRSFIEASAIGRVIPGLLQALPNTQLSRRLKQEGRLLEDYNVSGNTTIEGMNFIPKGEMTKRQYLQSYRQLVEDLYAPEAFFQRILPGLLALRDKRPLRVRLRIVARYFMAAFRMIYHIGIKTKDIRRYFWRTFLRLARENPDGLEAFSTDCYVYYCLHEHVAHVQKQISQYLRSPAPQDVLDDVIRPNMAPAVKAAVRSSG